MHQMSVYNVFVKRMIQSQLVNGLTFLLLPFKKKSLSDKVTDSSTFGCF